MGKIFLSEEEDYQILLKFPTIRKLLELCADKDKKKWGVYQKESEVVFGIVWGEDWRLQVSLRDIERKCVEQFGNNYNTNIIRFVYQIENPPEHNLHICLLEVEWDERISEKLYVRPSLH